MGGGATKKFRDKKGGLYVHIEKKKKLDHSLPEAFANASAARRSIGFHRATRSLVHRGGGPAHVVPTLSLRDLRLVRGTRGRMPKLQQNLRPETSSLDRKKADNPSPGWVRALCGRCDGIYLEPPDPRGSQASTNAGQCMRDNAAKHGRGKNHDTPRKILQNVARERTHRPRTPPKTTRSVPMIAAECPDRAVGLLPEIAGGYRRSMSGLEGDTRVSGGTEGMEGNGARGGVDVRRVCEKAGRARCPVKRVRALPLSMYGHTLEQQRGTPNRGRDEGE